MAVDKENVASSCFLCRVSLLTDRLLRVVTIGSLSLRRSSLSTSYFAPDMFPGAFFLLVTPATL